MFDYVCGSVASVGENRLVIDCGGIGFLINATASACAAFASEKQAKVPVYLAVREDALELYGFASEKERELFLMLIGVSGVGAKLAVTVLSGLNLQRLVQAIASSDIAALASVKGVGKKTAERIVLELKSKVEEVPAAVGQPALAATGEDAAALLMGLGMDRKEAEAAVRRVSKPGMTTEEIVRAALRG